MANEVTIHVKAKDAASKALDTIGKTIVRNMTQATIKLAGFAAAAGAAFPAVVTVLKPVVAWTYKLGTALVQAAPALAAFGVAGIFVKATLAQIFDKNNALVKSLTPLAKGFTDAGKAASKMAAEGIKPMVEDLIKSGFMDRVEGSMKKIGVEVNKVAFGMLTWVKTKPGAEAIGKTLTAIDKAVKGISTPITRVAMSFGEMVGRIAGVSLAAGKSGLTGVLNKLAAAMDRVTAASVSKGLKDFGQKVDEIKSFILQSVDAVMVAARWYKKWEKQINLVADALSVLSIALGIMGGGPILVIVGAVSLLVRHFRQIPKVVDKVKEAFSAGSEIFGPLVAAFEYMGREVLPEVRSGFRKIATAVLPVLRRIGNAIKNDLIPALGEFVVAVTPVVKVMVHRLAPIVAAVMKQVGRNVLLGVHVAAAAFRLMAAVIRTAVAAYNRLASGARSAVNGMRNAVRSAVNAVIALFRNLISRIRGAFAGAGGWLVGAGRAIVNGLISGIRGAAGAAASAAAGVVSRAIAAARRLIPGGRASGGYVGAGAATGGARGGQVLVGEQGPELVDLPFGSHVNSNADSQRLMGGRGKGGGDTHFHFHGPVYGDHDALKRALVNMKRSGGLDVVLR